MDKEFFYISLFNSKHIGDDGAYIDGFVYSADAFFEDVHFKREWMDLESIAQKAMLVNLSDAVAMNADPLYALITVALPKNFTPKELASLAKGFEKTAKEWGVEIIGGDTIASDKLHISITIVSRTKRPLKRKPLRRGYLLGYTGEIGEVGRDLRKLLRGGKVHRRSKFVRPRIRRDFMKRAHRVLRAAMDMSDGLFDDLGKMAKLNRVGVEFFAPIPKRQGCSGEEYELLFAIDPRDKKALLRRAKMSRTKINIFGRVVRGRYTNLCKPHHF